MTLYCLNKTFKLLKSETIMHWCQLTVTCQILRCVGWRPHKEQAGKCKWTVLFWSPYQIQKPHGWFQLFQSLLSEDNTCLVIRLDYHLWKAVEIDEWLSLTKGAGHFQKRLRGTSRELIYWPASPVLGKIIGWVHLKHICAQMKENSVVGNTEGGFTKGKSMLTKLWKIKWLSI